MHEMKIQISEIAENAKLELGFELDKDLVSQMLSETGYESKTASAKVAIERVGSTKDLRVSVGLDFEVSFSCGRCLELRDEAFEGHSDFVLMPESNLKARSNANDEIELEARDLDIVFHDSETVDLKPLIRETMLESLPTHSICSEEFSERCEASFEKNIGDAAVKDLEHAQVDLRWGPLLELKKNLKKD